MRLKRRSVRSPMSHTHTTPGWTSKQFCVMRVELLAEGEVEILLREHDDTVYSLNALTDVDAASDTNLPNPFFVGGGGPGTIISRIRASWAASIGEMVDHYQLQWKLSTNSTCQNASIPKDIIDVCISHRSATMILTTSACARSTK